MYLWPQLLTFFRLPDQLNLFLECSSLPKCVISQCLWCMYVCPQLLFLTLSNPSSRQFLEHYHYLVKTIHRHYFSCLATGSTEAILSRNKKRLWSVVLNSSSQNRGTILRISTRTSWELVSLGLQSTCTYMPGTNTISPSKLRLCNTHFAFRIATKDV